MLASKIGLTIVLFAFSTLTKYTVPPSHPRGQGGERQSSAQEIASLKANAEAGDAAAQLKLAHAYDLGAGVPQDDFIAAAWYRKAAEQGNSEAQDVMGGKYLLGLGVD